MRELDGAEAFTALSDLLEAKKDAHRFRCADGTAAERLRRSFECNTIACSTADRAVLIRHALRAEDARRRTDSRATLRTAIGSALDHDELLDRCGLQVRRSGDWVSMTAEPWRPDWIPSSKYRAVDESVAAAYVDEPRRVFDCGGAADDPFLKLFGFSRYRSVGQRAGVRAALLTPPGGTLVVDLPTSDGKSLVFRAIDALGFATDDDAQQGRGGVTLVVVPTVALALDHENSCLSELIAGPLAYVGGTRNAERNQLIRERVAAGEQGLCFAAPEACIGPLRWPLIEAAKRGAVKALVVDEAHLIDAWGSGFRTEFQQLAGLRLELLEEAGAGAKPRTLLLSATLSESARETLEDLFGRPGQFEVISAPQVRPEPEFWIAHLCNDDERDRRVREAVHRAPRPAILYVTKVADANRWYDKLLRLGFARLGRLTGETPAEERARILDRWRTGVYDLVVATSAFGLGVDYAHVRSVLHACVPESLDRFYQEVGRAGRDGRACLSLIMPAKSDFSLARNLAGRVSISIDRGLQRWTAMFRHPERSQITANRFQIRLDVAPGYEEDDIDMLSGRSTDWNARTLVLMARSGLIRFCGRPRQDISKEAEAQVADDEACDASRERRGEFEAIEIVDPAHLDKATWQEKVEPVRQKLFQTGQDNLKRLTDYLSARHCPADLVAGLYGEGAVDKVCGGCDLCRADPGRQKIPDPRREPGVPWPPAPDVAPILKELCEEGRVVVFFDSAAQGRTAMRVLRETLRGLAHLGLRRFGVLGKPSPAVDAALESLSDRPIFVARGRRPFDCRLPPGPRALIYDEGAEVETVDLEAREPGFEQFLFFPLGARGAPRHDLLLRETWDRARISLEELHGRIGR